jgi:hypothetical protein
MKRKQNTKNFKRKTNNNVPVNVPRPISIMGQMLRRPVIKRETIQSVSGSQYLNFTTSSSNYYGLFQFGTSVDFTAIIDGYQFFRVVSISIEVSRRIPETTINTLYTSGLPSISIAYYPLVTNVALSNALIMDNEFQLLIPGITQNMFRKSWLVPSAFTSILNNGFSYLINPSQCLEGNLTALWPGQLSIGVFNSSSTATATIPIYDVKLTYDIIFAAPF